MTEYVKQATYATFWKRFNIPAYEENSVPTGKKKPSFPYITYEVSTGTFNETITLTASLWYRSATWNPAVRKASEIASYITNSGCMEDSKDNTGSIWIKKGTPFTQRMPDEAEDNMIKRVLLNLEVEFISEDD